MGLVRTDVMDFLPSVQGFKLWAVGETSGHSETEVALGLSPCGSAAAGHVRA